MRSLSQLTAIARYVIGGATCDGCNQAKPDMIEIFWVSGMKHYCQKCWPSHRDFYELEADKGSAIIFTRRPN